MNRGRFGLVGSVLVLLSACKLEPVRELDASAPPPAPAPLPLVRIPEVAKITPEMARIESDLRSQLALLSSPNLAGRRPGSAGARLAIAYLERTMQDMGLAPPTFAGGWQQPVTVRVQATEAAALNVPNKSGGSDATLTHGDTVLLWRDQGVGPWSTTAPLVFAGWGVTAPDLNHDDYNGLDVTGKVVVVQDGTPPDRGFDPEAQRDYGSIAYKIERARRVGAVGCLVATDAEPGSDHWQQLVQRYAAPRFDLGGTDVAVRARIGVAGILSAPAYAQLGAIAASDTSLLDKATLTVNTTEALITDPNIVGMVVGTEIPDELVIVTAHWDAGGVSPPTAQGGAAIDNATGVATMLVVASRFADWARLGRRPKRSLAFAATASDTLDLAGTRALVQQGPWKLENVVAAIDLDALALGSGGPPLCALGLDESFLAQEVRHRRPSVRAIADDAGPHPSPGYRVFRDNAVPAVTLTRGQSGESDRDVVRSLATTNLNDLADDADLLIQLLWLLADAEAEAEAP